MKETAMAGNEPRCDIHQEITDRIVAAIERGAERFEMPWHRGGISQGRPANALSRRGYRGINVLALWVAAESKGYTSGYWATYGQWQNLGAGVKKGQKATRIVFYRQIVRDRREGEQSDDETVTYFAVRFFSVFNADQVNGWRPPEQVSKGHVEALAQAEGFIRNTGAVIRHGGARAYYHPARDDIVMPDRSRFVDTPAGSATEGYYATLFHELTHWTGDRKRVNRSLSGRFGDKAYAMEELVAELGGAFLCADLGVSNTPRADHASYVAGWLEVLKKDRKAVFTAANRAHEAAEYLACLQPRAEAAA